MSISSADYEKLGQFYLGRGYDPETKVVQDDLILYDSKDLVTHGVVLGMTGSGKTGLCLALLEEAAMDNIPAIIIDPKGDISNLLLMFPDLDARSFRPWINEDDAAKKAAFKTLAELWNKDVPSVIFETVIERVAFQNKVQGVYLTESSMFFLDKAWLQK